MFGIGTKVSKFDQILLSLKKEKGFQAFPQSSFLTLEKIAKDQNFTYSQTRILLQRIRDLEQWSLGKSFPLPKKMEASSYYWERLSSFYHDLLWSRDYKDQPPLRTAKGWNTALERAPQKILGSCPVNDPRTRCCGLQTLDVVRGCGYGCSYCSIQSFTKEQSIGFWEDLPSILNSLEIKNNTYYHIGTGQSSDSLLWGNRYSLLSDLFQWLEKQPNVVLELKTNSKGFPSLSKLELPSNLITGFSLSPQKVIDWEEHGTASLSQRIQGAKEICEKGGWVGFHFHPMFYYRGWEEDYLHMAEMIMKEIPIQKIIFLSMGSLTYTGKVLRQIRSSNDSTRVLQTPLELTHGKYSPPYELKKQMFSLLYHYLQPWKNKAYIYLCMEDPPLWKDVMGFEYKNNKEFGKDMLKKYRGRMGLEFIDNYEIKG